MQQGSCCPKGSWPRLQANYQPKGQRLQIANTQCYHVGQGNKVLILVSDIFGATSGKHEAFADTFSSLGYNVYLPEILTQPYNGQMNMEKIVASIKSQDYEKMKNRFQGLIQHLEQKGHKRYYVIGFCWGVWFAFKMATELDSFICIGGMHPSLGVEQIFGGDVNQLAKKIKCPAYLFPAGNDPDNIKTGGQVVNLLREKFGDEKVRTHEFPDMIHGWTVRGDISDQKVKRDISSAIQMCHHYFEKFE